MVLLPEVRCVLIAVTASQAQAMNSNRSPAYQATKRVYASFIASNFA